MERKGSDYSTYSQRSTVQTPRLKIRSAPQAESLGRDGLAPPSLIYTASFSSGNQSSSSLASRYAGSEAPSGFDSRRSSVISTSFQQSSPSGKAPKKMNFFSSLFTAKEPSIQALADYEKQLKDAATLRDKGQATVRMPGVSSAKMPAHVPKTNSKWDGNPATANKVIKKDSNLSKDRLQPPSRGSFGHRSNHSSSSDSMRQSIKRPASRATLGAASFHTAHSNQSRNQLAEVYGWEITDYSNIGVADSSSSIQGGRANSIRNSPIYASDVAYDEALESPQIPDEYKFRTPEKMPSSPQLPAHSHSPALTPREELPVTPFAGSPVKEIDSTGSGKTLQGQDEQPQDDVRETIVEAPRDAGEVVLASSGLHILSPPITARKRATTIVPNTKEQKVETPKEPKSILKKESAFAVDEKSQQQSALDSLFSQTAVLDYYHGPQWKKKMGVHNGRRAQRLTATTANGMDGKVSPTPESGNTMHRRKSIVGMFKA